MNNILIVIDFQNDFVTGALANTHAQTIEPNVVNAVQNAIENDAKVLFTKDTHPKEYLQTREGKHLPIPHCIQDTQGWQLTKALEPFENNANVGVINKPTFGSEQLPKAVLAMCENCPPEEIHVCGLVTDICVICNAIILHSAFVDSKIVVHQNLCAGLTPEKHNQALALMAGLGIEIV